MKKMRPPLHVSSLHSPPPPETDVDLQIFRSAGVVLVVRSLLTTLWPPNCFRRAAQKRAEKFSLSRDSKRAKRLAAMTGAGTFSSIAAATVHRPSPESSTYG